MLEPGLMILLSAVCRLLKTLSITRCALFLYSCLYPLPMSMIAYEARQHLAQGVQGSMQSRERPPGFAAAVGVVGVSGGTAPLSAREAELGREAAPLLREASSPLDEAADELGSACSVAEPCLDGSADSPGLHGHLRSVL